jgi:dihydrodipicolinate synthase/N-acetylneuraminate lyase
VPLSWIALVEVASPIARSFFLFASFTARPPRLPSSRRETEMTSSSRLQGVFPMLFAFFDERDQLDREAMRRQVEALVGWRVHGLAVLGLASEVNKLNVSERQMLLEWVAEDLAGRLPLAVTVAEPSIPGQIDFVRTAADSGAEWIILQPPPVHGITEAELVRFFGAVAASATGPLGLQLAPEFLSAGLSAVGLNDLHRNHPNVTHLKVEATPLAIRRLIEDTNGDFVVFNGRAGLEIVDSIDAGCAGMIPGAECADRLSRIYDSLASGSEEGRKRADADYQELSGLITFLFASLDSFLLYGKVLAGRRFGIKNVAPREPAGRLTPYGMQLLDRHSSFL